jgi:hypothetical protein
MLKKATEKLKKDPWHKKLRRWYRFNHWILVCKIRIIVNHFKQQEK